MKRFLIVTSFVFAGFSAFAQPNLACFHDTSMVEEVIFKKDTSFAVRPEFQKGDWNLYYDYALTKIKSEYHYTETGEKTGTWKEFYKNGSKKAEWDYSNPLIKIYPPGKEYYENGVVKTERTQTADSLFETQYFANGKLKATNKWDKTGKWVKHHELYENGQLLVDYNPTAASPEAVKKYHSNGKLRAEYNYYAFGFTGKYKEFHSNGKIAVDGQYTEKPADVAAFMARKNGTWTFYDEKGNVTKTEVWDNGKLVSKQ